MKKAKGNSSPSESKDDARAVDKYIADLPEPARSTLKKIRAMIRSASPAETTEGFSYGIPVFKYKGPFFCYAAFANHCSLFPMSGRVIEQFKSDLQKFDTSKGTIRFPLDKPPSVSLVKKLVKARVALQEQKKAR